MSERKLYHVESTVHSYVLATPDEIRKLAERAFREELGNASAEHGWHRHHSDQTLSGSWDLTCGVYHSGDDPITLAEAIAISGDSTP